MQVEVNEQFKFASVWLTNEEKENADVINSLQPLIEQYKSMKYKFVIFQSGKQDLVDLTKDLLSHNKNLDKSSINGTMDVKHGKKPSLQKKLAALNTQVHDNPQKAEVKKTKNLEKAL